MLESQLQPAQAHCCVVTAFQKNPAPQKTNGTLYNDPEAENRPAPPSHNASKGDCDGRWSCSGVIVDPRLGVALCHGAIFFPFLNREFRDVALAARDVILAGEFPRDLAVRVECSAEQNNQGGRVAEPQPGLGLVPMSNQAGVGAGRKQLEAQLLMLVPCPDFQRAFSKLFNKSDGWVFSSEEEYVELRNDLAYLHWFAVLKLQSPVSNEAARISFMPASKLLKGGPVYACGSPFGSFYPDIFLNTISRGVVSNLAGKHNVVLLTDARCLPGSEGGGIFAFQGGVLHLVGLIVAPLCWKANEWVGLTLACSVSHVLDNLIEALEKTGMAGGGYISQLMPVEDSLADLTPCLEPTEAWRLSVVLVDSGQVWGSGVFLNANLVLTCRHVVRGASRVTVRIRSPTADKYRGVTAQVVFSSDEDSPYDIALVEVEESFHGIQEPVLASTYCVGEDVCVLGYGAFGENCGPSVTSGVLSAVICVGNEPVMLQTTCAVHGGSSGGPLFATQSGQLLGIVASNTRDNSTGAAYPHLNFSIPVTVLQDALHRYREHGHLHGFQEINTARRAVRDVWRLQRNPEKALSSKL
ncbi:peroxisomal leader peptide-processing protease [Pelodytes ibericus]